MNEGIKLNLDFTPNQEQVAAMIADGLVRQARFQALADQAGASVMHYRAMVVPVEAV